MEYRPLALGAGVIRTRTLVLLLAAGLAGTTFADAPDDGALQVKRQRAAQLEREARALRTEASRVYKDEEAACYQRFLVNDCIKGAKEKRLGRIVEARRKESEQAALEREIRYAELAARRAAKARQRAEEGPPPAVITQPDRPPLEGTPLR